MTFAKKLVPIGILCVFTSIFLLLTGCNSAENTGIESNSNNVENIQAANDVLTIHGILEEKTEDQLFEQSSLIVVASVKDIGSAFRVKSSTGSLCNFTDYTVEIDTVLRGEAEEKTLTVRVQGGTVDGITEVYSPAPELKLGEEYLLFLYQPARGGSFNTTGDYYYILGLTQGVFQKYEDVLGEDNTDVYISQDDYEITYGHVEDRAYEYPIDKQYFRNEYIENQKRNLENGFISQSEYDDMMEAIDEYATIISEDSLKQ